MSRTKLSGLFRSHGLNFPLNAARSFHFLLIKFEITMYRFLYNSKNHIHTKCLHRLATMSNDQLYIPFHAMPSRRSRMLKPTLPRDGYLNPLKSPMKRRYPQSTRSCNLSLSRHNLSFPDTGRFNLKDFFFFFSKQTPLSLTSLFQILHNVLRPSTRFPLARQRRKQPQHEPRGTSPSL